MLDVKSHVLYAPPVSLEGMESARDCVVCVTGYQGQRRRDVETMSRVLGAKFQKAFDRHVTHLVCYEHAGAKWERARDLGTSEDCESPVVGGKRDEVDARRRIGVRVEEWEGRG